MNTISSFVKIPAPVMAVVTGAGGGAGIAAYLERWTTLLGFATALLAFIAAAAGVVYWVAKAYYAIKKKGNIP